MENRQKKTMMTTLLILGLVMSLGGWMVSMTRKDLLLKRQINEEVENLKAKKIELDKLMVDYEEFDGLTPLWTKWLPRTEEEVARFAKEVERLSSDSGLVLETTFDDFPKKIGGKDNYVQGLEVDWELKGGYGGMVRFLDGLERMNYLLKVRKVSVTKSKEEGTQLNMIVSGVLLMGELEEKGELKK